MGGVQQPLEVDGADVADRVGCEKFFDSRVDRVVAVIEGDRQIPASLGLYLENSSAAGTSIVIGFSVMTLQPRCNAMTMYSS